MATTAARIKANRANAQRSTGPRTPEGKSRSRINALRHGLTGQVFLMPEENLAAFQAHCQIFFDYYKPQWWDGDPLFGGNFVSNAPTASRF